MALLKFNTTDEKFELKGEDEYRGYDYKRGLWVVVYWSYTYSSICIVTMINSWEIELGIYQNDVVEACNNYIDYWLDMAVYATNAKHAMHSTRIDQGKILRTYFTT